MTADFFEFQARLKRPQSSAAPSSTAHEKPLSVSELTTRIKRVIDSGFPANVLVRGELSNFNRNASSGHLYLTLKDAGACLDCVMYRDEASRLKFQPVAGMELLAGGRVGVYPQRGRYQLYINTLRPVGQGAMELAFQQVRARLAAQGLFARERKKPLPKYPRRIVIITSPAAAALQDVLKVLRRFNWLRLSLYAVAVQGEGAAAEIAEAIRRVNQPHCPSPSPGGQDGPAGDVILLVRGGGSAEDLWSFNEEIVARAVAACKIPIVTGIGHEVDVSIADLAADYHAHTPTEAAQVITAHWRGVDELLNASSIRLRRSLGNQISDAQHRLRAIERHEAFRRPTDRVNTLRQLLDDRQRALASAAQHTWRNGRDRLHAAAVRIQSLLPSLLIRHRELLSARQQRLDQTFSQRLRQSHDRLARSAALLQEHHPRFQLRLSGHHVDSIEKRLVLAALQRLRRQGERLDGIWRQLDAVNPRSVLRRGYTITTRKKDGLSLTSAAHLKPGDKLVTRFADGETQSVVEDARQLSLFE